MLPNSPAAIPAEPKFLKRFATGLMAMGAFFAPTDFFHFYQQQNPIFILMGTLNLAILAASYYARRMAVRQQLSRAALIMSYICLVPPPVMILVTPGGRATLVLIPVFALLLSLSYADQKSIRRLAILVFFVECWVGAMGSILPETANLTPMGSFLMYGTSVPLGYLFIAVLIFHYSGRLNTALTQALTAVRARDEFIALASHELKTPLASLKLQVHLLLEDAQKAAISQDEKSEPIVLQLRKTDRHVNRLNSLVDAMLDVSRIRNGKFALSKAKVDLSHLVREAIDRLQIGLQAAKIEVQLETGGPVIGQWDYMRMEQVVINLLTNAMKYGAGKPVEITVGLEGESAVLSVRDHGIGIFREDQTRIFDRFERAVPANHFGGLGLGLYVTNQIVLAHEGQIRVESEPGQGATFIVNVPCGLAGKIASTLHKS